MVTTRRSRRRPPQPSPERQPESSRRSQQPTTPQTTNPVTTPEQETVTTPVTQTPTPDQTPTYNAAQLPPPPPDHPYLIGVNAVLDELRKQNHSLQQQVDEMKQERDPNSIDGMQIDKPQPLIDVIMNDLVPPNFKPPPLESYDGRRDPQEHLTAFDTQMAIIGAHETLKCKLFSGTMKGAALVWFMSLPRHSVVSYSDFTKKFLRHFSDRKHKKASTATLFNTRQRPNESLREYLGRFSDITVDVEYPDQTQFADAFTNGL